MPQQVFRDPGVDPGTRQRVVKHGGPDPHCGGPGDQKLQGIRGRGDPALADDRHLVGAGLLVDLPGLEQGDRLDGRTGQPALNIGQHRPALLDIHRHPGERVDDGKRVGAGLDTAACVLPDVGLIRRKLGNEWLGCRLPAGGHNPG